MLFRLCFFAAATVIALRLVLLAHLHTTGARHPVRDAVSDYGVGPTRHAFEVMTLTVTAGWWLLAIATWGGYPHWSDRTWATTAFAITGVTTAVMRFFPTDLPGEQVTPTGLIHYALAITQFALSYSVMGNVTRLLNDSVSPVLRMIALVGLVGLCVLLIPALRRKLGLFGLFERIFLVTVALFYLYYAMRSGMHLA